jgi:hypothetical protein
LTPDFETKQLRNRGCSRKKSSNPGVFFLDFDRKWAKVRKAQHRRGFLGIEGVRSRSWRRVCPSPRKSDPVSRRPALGQAGCVDAEPAREPLRHAEWNRLSLCRYRGKNNFRKIIPRQKFPDFYFPEFRVLNGAWHADRCSKEKKPFHKIGGYMSREIGEDA